MELLNYEVLYLVQVQSTYPWCHTKSYLIVDFSKHIYHFMQTPTNIKYGHRHKIYYQPGLQF